MDAEIHASLPTATPKPNQVETQEITFESL